MWLESLLTPGALQQAPEGAVAALSVGPLSTDARGVLSLALPPGRYAARAVANSAEPLDPAAASLEFSPDPANPSALLAGFSLPLRPPPSMDVPILSALDTRTFAATSFELSTPQDSSLQELFRSAGPSPRGATGLTDGSGTLRATPDSGLYDLVVRIPPESGFPWLVKPRVSLPLDTPGALRVSLPVEVQGRILDPTLGALGERPFAGAWIRVFARADGGFLPIAAAPLDPNGSYRILLPSRL